MLKYEDIYLINQAALKRMLNAFYRWKSTPERGNDMFSSLAEQYFSLLRILDAAARNGIKILPNLRK